MVRKARRMARALPAIDVEDSPELERLVEELQVSGEPVVLRRDGEPVAVVLSPDWRSDRERGRELSEAERRAFLTTAGGWKGLLDVDRFIEDNYESRRISTRPPVDLE
jgi:hypothetical protein